MSLNIVNCFTDWPNPGKYKVVQIVLNNEPYLLIGSLSAGHQGILKHFLRSNQIEYEIIEGESGEIPCPSGKKYLVKGMGQVDITMDGNKKQVSFWGDSYDYNIRIDKEQLSPIKNLYTDWLVVF